MRALALISWIPSLLWCVFFLSTIVGTEILVPNSRISSDFHLNFYSAGYLVAHNQTGILYPPSNATTFINTPFDQFLHQFYPTLSKNLYGTFLYTPLVAVLFAVFAPLPANIALLVFQAINLAGIAWLGLKAERAVGIDARKVFLGSMLFFPIAGTLWLGQVSMLFGLFPLVAGYYLLQKNKSITAGLLWSLMSLKPQFLPVPFVIAIATGNFRCLWALIVGCAALLTLNVFCLTPAIFSQWLFDTTRLANAMFTANVSHLVACVPGTIIMCLPESAPPASRLIIFAAAAGMATLAMLFVFWHVKKNAAKKDRLAITTIVALLALPVYSRLFNYDLALLSFASLLMFSNQWSAKISHSMRQLTIVMWIGLNLQFVVAASGTHSVSPLVTGLMLTVFCAWGCVLATKIDKEQAPVSEEQTLP
ncbi:MAG: glycosyltransferase family 87 protein [Candidatus Obscuribacterales bacterium]|nr:glycosyltransferase family 87 protein [Candidatus Obscuribacterales bacterium]